MANGMELEPDDLAHLPGAPFTQGEIDAAVATVQSAAGWHIAPLVEDQTVVLDVVSGESWLRLPTRKLVSVSEVRDTDTDEVIASSRYRVSFDRGQIVRKTGFWPCGYGRVEVDFTHGYATVPADLLTVIGEAAITSRRDQSVRQQEAGVFSVTYGAGGAAMTGSPLSSGSAFQRYSLWWQPGIA